MVEPAAGPVAWSHYCEDQKNKVFVIWNMDDLKVRKFEIPYDSTFLSATIQINYKIYFTGGGLRTEAGKETFFQKASCITFEPMTGDISVKHLENMNVSRANHAMAAIGEKQIYVVGGCNTKAELPSCEVYNVDTNKWANIAYLNEKKIWPSVCTFNNRYLYSFGGARNIDPKQCDTIESLDTTDASAKKWTIIQVALGKENLQATFFSGVIQITPEKILLFGGLTGKKEISSVISFEPSTRKVAKCADTLSPDAFYRTRPTVKGTEMKVVGSVAGDIHIYDITAGTWKIIKKEIWNADKGVMWKSDTY